MENIRRNIPLIIKHQKSKILNNFDIMIREYETFLKESEINKNLAVAAGIKFDELTSKNMNGYIKIGDDYVCKELWLASVNNDKFAEDIALKIFRELVEFDKQRVLNSEEIVEVVVEVVDKFYKKSIIYKKSYIDKIRYSDIVDSIMKNITGMSKNTINGIYRLLFGKNVSKINYALSDYISDLNMMKEYQYHIYFDKICDIEKFKTYDDNIKAEVMMFGYRDYVEFSEYKDEIFELVYDSIKDSKSHRSLRLQFKEYPKFVEFLNERFNFECTYDLKKNDILAGLYNFEVRYKKHPKLVKFIKKRLESDRRPKIVKT